jgi:hypothetical protein
MVGSFAHNVKNNSRAGYEPTQENKKRKAPPSVVQVYATTNQERRTESESLVATLLQGFSGIVTCGK